jgi:putative aldouronate transport system substrate-binding protein
MVITSVAYQMAPIAENPKMINYYNKMFNIDLQIWNVDNGRYDEQLNLKFAANEIPDIFRSTLPNLQKYYDQQIMAEIPESMMKEKMPLVYNSSKAAAPDFLERGKVNNKIYMLPSQISVPIRGPAVYRGDWIKAVGKQDAPKTLAELEALLYLFANNDPDKNGKKDTYGLSNSGFNMVYGAFGYIPGQWQERNGSLVYSSIQPEIKEALTVLAKWYKDGVIDPEFITGENKGGYWALSHAFIEERIGFSGLGSYYHWHFTPAASQNYRELKAVNATAADSLIFGEPVTGPRGAKGLAMGAPIGSTSEAFGVQVEKDPLKMGKIMELWNHFFESNDAYLTGWMGILGEEWDYNENKAPIPRAHADINWLAGNGAHTVTAVIYRPDDVTVRTPYFAPILENLHYF